MSQSIWVLAGGSLIQLVVVVIIVVISGFVCVYRMICVSLEDGCVSHQPAHGLLRKGLERGGMKRGGKQGGKLKVEVA